MKINCIFFDVGNVIISDNPFTADYYWRLARAIRQRVDGGFSHRRLLAEREELIVSGASSSPASDLGRKYLGVEGMRAFDREYDKSQKARRTALILLIPGAREVLEDLRGRVKLGLIANQPPECEGDLRRFGLWDLFSVHGISEVIGLSKPDLRFFQWACEQAHEPPERCLMIGDRLDNDVAPAKQLGMTTVWLHWRSPFDQRIAPRHQYERLYFESVARASVANQGSVSSDHTCHSIPELHGLLMRLLEAGV